MKSESPKDSGCDLHSCNGGLDLPRMQSRVCNQHGHMGIIRADLDLSVGRKRRPRVGPFSMRVSFALALLHRLASRGVQEEPLRALARAEIEHIHQRTG